MSEQKKEKKDWLRIVILVFLVGVFAVSAWKVGSIIAERIEAKKHYQEIAESYVTPLPPEDSGNEGSRTDSEESSDDGLLDIDADVRVNPYGAPIWVNFEALLEANPDVVGWLYSAGTPINYPIVRASDNSYYLYRDFDRDFSRAGSLFMDCENKGDWSEPNNIIYGHNLKGSDIMFGTLTAYMRQSYYNGHKEMWLFTENHVYKVYLYAGYTTRFITECYSNFRNNQSGFKEWIKWAGENSDFKSEVLPTDVTKTVTFSTCTTNYEQGYRYIVVGSLVEIFPKE